ncbi:MAG: UDP-N-acetylmuramoylalanine--D-glutamate ligase [Alphaproteobacteria bacterium MarineAlpha9_Bin4]|nr:UDP-N-acetylmuramoyl-L-alanine--D-glutamate ligase [Pelagibacterales bacterium]PPR27669.1 MAG: UDP-N-acetylmuramoylalanine--D-glutamate ligase [Alphaproteobacteria bacterium MarineAlpha9_Bin4]
MEEKLKNKNILIIGYGNTGKSLGAFLWNKKNNIYFWDDNQNKLDNLDKAFYKYNGQKVNLFDCIYASPGIKKDHKIIKKAIKSKVKVSSDVELFLDNVAGLNSKNQLIAITGTNGKSTIALMIAKALKVKPLANFGNLVLENFPKKNEVLVLELSSFQLEYLHFIKPKISIISNIKEDHISYHGNFKKYFSSKTKINKFQDKNDFLILNYDDLYLRKHFRKKSQNKSKIVWVSLEREVSKGIFFNKDVLIDNFFSKSNYVIKKSTFLKQNHNKLNFAISYAALKCLGLDSNKIIKSLIKFSGLPHRMEYVGSLNNIYFYNDSKATNVSATCSALESFKKVFLIAGGSKKDTSFNPLANYSDKVYEAYLIGETANDIKKVLGKFCKSFICDDLEDAVRRSYRKSFVSKKNYPILLSPACASFDKYENFESRGKDFKRIFNKISSGKA